jgi:hypothetical protein
VTGEPGDPAGGIRLTDVLTTASAVANYLGAGDVTPAHLRTALAIVLGEGTIEDAGRPVSPLVRRQPGGSAQPAVRELVQRWFAALGGDPLATFTPEQLARFRADVEALPP